jgi:hypothetical protein
MWLAVTFASPWPYYAGSVAPGAGVSGRCEAAGALVVAHGHAEARLLDLATAVGPSTGRRPHLTSVGTHRLERERLWRERERLPPLGRPDRERRPRPPRPGTLAPSWRASFRPIAIACSRLFTFLPDLPERSVPCLRSCIALSTFCDAPRPYRRPPRPVFLRGTGNLLE